MKPADDARLHCRTSRGCDNPPTDCMCRCLDCTEANLTEIALWWEELLDDRFPGTRRRWHERAREDLPPTHDCGTPWVFEESVTAKGRQGRDDFEAQRPRCPNPACADTDAIGFSPAPARDDVIDAIAEVTWGISELRDDVAATLNAGRRKLRVPEACTWIISALPAISRGKQYDDISKTAQQLAHRVRAATGQLEDVVQINAACPICGKRSLRAHAVQMVVSCHSDVCRCEAVDCGCQIGYPRSHSWPVERLAVLINSPAEEAS